MEYKNFLVHHSKMDDILNEHAKENWMLHTQLFVGVTEDDPDNQQFIFNVCLQRQRAEPPKPATPERRPIGLGRMPE